MRGRNGNGDVMDAFRRIIAPTVGVATPYLARNEMTGIKPVKPSNGMADYLTFKSHFTFHFFHGPERR